MNHQKLLLKIQKIHPDAPIPKVAYQGDAGADLTAMSVKYDGPEFIEFGTGISIEIPEGYVGILAPRSSISNKSNMLANAIGVIDSNFRGEISARFRKLDTYQPGYQLGDKIAQLIIIPYYSYDFIVVNQLDKSERGSKGFGSSK